MLNFEFPTDSSFYTIFTVFTFNFFNGNPTTPRLHACICKAAIFRAVQKYIGMEVSKRLTNRAALPQLTFFLFTAQS